MQLLSSKSVALMLLGVQLLVLASSAEAQNAPSQAQKSVIPAAAASPAPAPAAEAFIGYVKIYFLDDVADYNERGKKTARQRVDITAGVLRRVRSETSYPAIICSIPKGANLDEMAADLKGGEDQAKKLLPFLRNGWHYILILDKDGKGVSEPTPVSPYDSNVYELIQIAREMDREIFNPQRYAAPAPAVDTAPKPTKPQSKTSPPANLPK